MPSRHLLFLMLAFGYVTGLSFVFAGESEKHSALTAVDTFYVSPAGSNAAGTGAKNSPWRSVAFALSKLSADSLNPKVIKLAAGVYSAATTGESFPLYLKNWVSLIGDNNLNTIIDANKSARVLYGLNVANMAITQVTARNGLARIDTGDASRGGGMMLRNCRQIVVKNCVLRSNEAQTLGGGAFLDAGSDITFENNLIETNIAIDGAGIYCSRTKSAKLLANVIQQNTAANSAGGVYLDFAAALLQRNRIRRNSASPALSKNAGGIVVRSANPIIGGSLNAGNDIHDNSGGALGAQLYVIENAAPVNARFNYWGAIPSSALVTPLAAVDLSNYRNLAISIPLGAVEFHVAPNGSDSNNGASHSPWRTLAYAFSQIFATSIDSLTIRLAPGIYSAAATGEQFPIDAKSNITILGNSNTLLAPTVISGENVSAHELIRLENLVTFRLANLVFKNYKTNIKTSAIRARASENLVIENCIFEDNQSQRGAAMTLIEVKSSTVRNNVFRRNHSTDTGGAVALLNDATDFSGNIFTDNSAANGGGAAHCDSTSETRFTQNEFKNNSAAFGGAFYVTRSNVRFSNNRLWSNRATVSGGAMALDGASLPQIGARSSQANDIYFNTAVKSGSQIQRLDPGIKVDARHNYWGQIPDSTMLAPFAQFAADNFRQVVSRMPADIKAIYVSPMGDDAALGTSRSQALRTIGEALRLVVGTEKNPLTVHLLPGKFSAATNGETFPIALESDIILRGAGRDSTTVDAAASHRVFEGRDLAGSVIAHLNIVGGKAPSYGGAILVREAKTAATRKAAATTIENCRLQTNYATHGGALAAVRNYKTIMRNCVITNNLALQNGGAVFALGDSVEIKDSELFLNRAQKDGGGVHLDSAAALTLTNNNIHDNTATLGGGVAVTNGLSRLWRNFILDNTALGSSGGGVYLGANGKAIIGGVLNNGNDIYGNRAAKSGKELSSAPRSDKVEARFNFFGGKPIAALVDNPNSFDLSSYRYVTITAPEKSREFYLSPMGNDNNAGVNNNSPWKTIAAALRRFFTEPGDSVKLHLRNGAYSASATGEIFPIRLPHRVTLIGQNIDSVIFDGEKQNRLFEINFALRVRLQNLTISNGNYAASGQPLPDFSSTAGGVRIHKSAFIYFNQVAFRGNKTVGEGGGLSADSSQQVFISNCRFLENQGRGGAIFFHRIGGEIRASEFKKNRSLDNGSAIYLSDASPQISGNIIAENEAAASEGGAIFCKGSILPVIGGAPGQGNDIYNNAGGARGQAITRLGNAPMINATFNYFGNGAINETLVYPLNGFDLRFSRDVPIVTNGKPIITQLTPPANQPLRVSLFDTVKFQVAALDPDNDLLTLAWTLDDGPTPVGYGPNYDFFPFFAGTGEHLVRIVVSDQKETATASWKVMISTTSVKERQEALPKTFALQQNFPNPLRNAEALTVIPYQIPKVTNVALAVYDLLGRRVRLLEQSQQAAGFYQARWDGRDQDGVNVESGVYFIRMSAGEFTAMRKILVIR